LDAAMLADGRPPTAGPRLTALERLEAGGRAGAPPNAVDLAVPFRVLD
jgi:hypothetical protein